MSEESEDALSDLCAKFSNITVDFRQDVDYYVRTCDLICQQLYKIIIKNDKMN